jgi:hypothetical protein
MTAAVTALPPPDPIFALAPELKLHWSALDGRLVVNSREVARVFFRGSHQRVVRKIMQDIWDAPMRPDFEDIFRPCADGSIDMTSHGLDVALSHWGFGFRNKRVRQFNNMMAQLVCTTAKEVEAKTGTNPLIEGMKRFFPGVRSLYRTAASTARRTATGAVTIADCLYRPDQCCTMSYGPRSQSRTRSCALTASRSGSVANSRKAI